MTEIYKPLNISEIVRDIGASDEYKRARNNSEQLPLGDMDRRRRAIRLSATVLSSERKLQSAHELNVTAHLTDFMDSINELHDLDDQGAYHKEKLPALLKIAEFNRAVKDMVDSNPSLTYDQVLLFLRNMNHVINHDADDDGQFEHEARTTLTGIRHEIAVEQMLGHMPDVIYEDTSVEDDLKGADFLVSINGSKTTPIDIKASWGNAEKKKAKALAQGSNPHGIMWSHISPTDFGSSFRISNEAAALKAPELHTDLLNAVENYQIRTKRTA